MSDQYPSRELDKIVLRLPDGMKERIRRAADENGRSVNAELVTLLDRTYPADTAIDDCINMIAAIISRKPEEARADAWRSVFEKLEKVKG